MKKRAIVFLSLVLVLSLGVYMIAFAEGDALSLYNGVKKLLFDTNNVSLTAEATFKYDGELFKTFRGEYKQDDINSYLRIMLDTPKADGSVYTGGYTVVGNGSDVYSNDTINGNYYLSSNGSVENTLLQSGSSLITSLNLIEAGLRAISPQLDKYIVKQTASDGSGTYELKADSAPEFINAAATFVAQKYIESEYGYVNYDINSFCRSEFEDFNALFAVVYERVFEDKIPENYLADTESFTDEDWTKYSTVVDNMYADINAEALNYTGGVLLALADGTYKWFADEAEYMRAVSLDYVYYDDYAKAVSVYYEQKFGTPLTDDAVFAISNSANEDLWDAYNALTCEMDEHYKELAKQNADTVAIIVHNDGTYDEYSKDPYNFYTKERTVAQSIMATFSKLEIASLEAKVTDDADGMITAAKGAIKLAVTDIDGVRHSLEIEFDCKAYDYGSTEVAQFDPADYGFVTYEEYLTEQGIEPEQEFDIDSYAERLKNAPETIEFAGETYETQVYSYETYDY